MLLNRKSYLLSPQTCDDIAQDIMEFGDRAGGERKNLFRYRLFAEECLLNWISKGCEGRKIDLIMGKTIFDPYIRIRM